MTRIESVRMLLNQELYSGNAYSRPIKKQIRYVKTFITKGGLRDLAPVGISEGMKA